MQVYAAPLSDGTRAVVLLNRHTLATQYPLSNIKVDWSWIGFPSGAEVCRGSDTSFDACKQACCRKPCLSLMLKSLGCKLHTQKVAVVTYVSYSSSSFGRGDYNCLKLLCISQSGIHHIQIGSHTARNGETEHKACTTLPPACDMHQAEKGSCGI